MQDQEGRVTHFSSGIAGVAVVLFALMGTIGVGYLLNGTTATETVNDYDYVTDVSGLYSYTPVTAYAEYSPAQNNYQYNTSLSDLGTYTNGISYTSAASANLNPILTSASGTATTTGTLALSDMSYTSKWAGVYIGVAQDGDHEGDEHVLIMESKIVSLADIVADWTYVTGTITIPSAVTLDPNYATAVYVQPVGILTYPSSDLSTFSDTVNWAISNYTTFGYGRLNSGYQYITSSIDQRSCTISSLGGSWAGTYTNNDPVGVASDITLNPNNTATYSYTYNGVITSVTKNVSEIYLVILTPDNVTWSGYSFSGLDYSITYATDVDYLDPNYGVSLTGSPVYWSNGNNNGSVTWAFEKPSSGSTVSVQACNSGNELQYTMAVTWTGSRWTASYTDSSNTPAYVDLGSSWSAVYVRMYYTGDVEIGVLDGFFNFTNYTMKIPTAYTTYYSGNVPITECKLTASNTLMKFACIGTTIEIGNVPGAMYNGSFNLLNYFPDYDDYRLSFDSAAYVGTGVTVGTWSMAVDSSSFVGTFATNATYYVDLTQPWALVWDPDGGVNIVFSEVDQLGTRTVQILDDHSVDTVNLTGQWAIDTDLYSISTHTEEVYDWNFGDWGLDRTQFIVCAIGLTALISIAMKLGGVPFRALDFIVILFGNVILWVIM